MRQEAVAELLVVPIQLAIRSHHHQLRLAALGFLWIKAARQLILSKHIRIRGQRGVKADPGAQFPVIKKYRDTLASRQLYTVWLGWVYCIRVGLPGRQDSIFDAMFGQHL